MQPNFLSFENSASLQYQPSLSIVSANKLCHAYISGRLILKSWKLIVRRFATGKFTQIVTTKDCFNVCKHPIQKH